VREIYWNFFFFQRKYLKIKVIHISTPYYYVDNSLNALIYNYQDKQYNKMIQDLIFGYALSSAY